MSKVRRYKDTQGKDRVIVFERKLGYLVPSHKDEHGRSTTSTASIWKLEDGSLVQIPDNVWEYQKISYVDSES